MSARPAWPMRILRRLVVGRRQQWVFEPPPPGWSPARLDRTSLYVHVPFCRHACPYCPYTKVRYAADLVGPYTRAACRELDWWADRAGPSAISSIYVGGGTPTLAVDSVRRILDHARSRFAVAGPVCVETNPADVDADVVRQLRDAGVTRVSLGVQSFQAAHLAAIGRAYVPATAARALSLLAAGGFAAVNADLMFALPGQTVDDVVADLEQAASLGATQVTAYPLFTFPYTAVGRVLRLRAVRLPRLHARLTQYRAIQAWCEARGYRRVSVWAFSRLPDARYSSVTRDGYIGIGPGAGSLGPREFVFNTFDLEAWRAAADAGGGAVALRMPFGGDAAGWWWLYWRLYETRVPLAGLEAVLPADAARARAWLRAVERLGFAESDGDTWSLTDAGAFWAHLLQNYAALGSVNAVWTAARREPWPGAVRI